MNVQHHAAALRRLVLDRLAVLDAGRVGPRLVEHEFAGGAVDRDEQSGHPCLGIRESQPLHLGCLFDGAVASGPDDVLGQT